MKTCEDEFMRLIPVMDLMNNLVVHGIRGEREHYRPVKSILCETAEPLSMAKAFRDQLGLRELYIADLDAIQGNNHHQTLIGDLARQEGMECMLDAGAADIEAARAVLATGARKVVIGLETLLDWDASIAVRAVIPADRLVFSLDMHAGRLLSPSPILSALSPFEVLDLLQQERWREVILLDLARVGTEAGIDWELITSARRRFPDLALLVGGGIRAAGELETLKAAGIAGVLVATTLHRGTIRREHIQCLNQL